jgi:hypothetical protein
MHHQFNIQQLYALPTLYLCVLYLSENKERIAPLHKQIGFYSGVEKRVYSAARTGYLNKAVFHSSLKC